MSHTPTPWIQEPDDPFIYKLNVRNTNQFCFGIQGGHLDDGRPTPREELLANAAHIVHCVNTHDQLVAALQKISANAAESTEWIRRVANQALAAAEKGA